MKMTKITVAKGVTINIGNYESIRIDVSADFEMGPKDKSGPAFTKSFDFLDQQINIQLADVQGLVHQKSAFKTN